MLAAVQAIEAKLAEIWHDIDGEARAELTALLADAKAEAETLKADLVPLASQLEADVKSAVATLAPEVQAAVAAIVAKFIADAQSLLGNGGGQPSPPAAA